MDKNVMKQIIVKRLSEICYGVLEVRKPRQTEEQCVVGQQISPPRPLFFFIFDIVFPIDLVGLSISFIAKSIASSIKAFTLGFR